ncbi:MAG: MMPL family transporter, partial [Aeoliella sp.]
PDDSTSRRGLDLLQRAFPDEKAKSQIVLVFAREDGPLTKIDRQFAIDTSQNLAQLQVSSGEGKQLDLPWADKDNRVWTELTPVVGRMLKNNGRTSKVEPSVAVDGETAVEKHLDGHAVMVVGRLTTDMMATENVGILKAVTGLVEEARASDLLPEGLQVGLSGSAMIGGDMQASVKESLKSTEITTVCLVGICLFMIYRSPLLIVIPMATIGISLSVASDTVALLALHFGPDDFAWSDFKIFTTTKIFVIVILFGAGTDFCLFLISRFKEELGLGTKIEQASGTALTNVGDALAASAFTTILGLATMIFAEYGKFSYAGPVVAICLFIALLACISFAPALLRAFGKFVFWPFGVKTEQEKVDPKGDFDAQMKRISPIWDWIACQVLRRPGLILWLALGASAWFMIEGLGVEVTHDFMNELAADRASKQGTELVREYFAPGEAAPMSVVATLPGGKLDEDDGYYKLSYLHYLLQEIDGVADVRSLYKPAGGSDEAPNLAELTVTGSPLAVSTFVSEAEGYRGEVTQFHLVLEKDPFAREARTIVDDIEIALNKVTSGEAVNEKPPRGLSEKQLERWNTIREDVPLGLSNWKGAEFEYIGTTPGMRDLQHVTSRDETTIKICVVIAVFAVIVLILKRPMVCVYLIVTVLLSYFATIGATEMFFSWYYGATFDGLDWKAPIFLFVILIAVGQDYNIYLSTRVFEEQAKLGLRRGLRRAMVQTGGIITSCGIIMAGTFISMASGTLRGMIELGFALSLGVLLDTFFVRTVVVPCFFALMAGKETKVPDPPVEEPPAEVSPGATRPPTARPNLPHSAVTESAS